MNWPFSRSPAPTPSDAARTLAKIGHDQRHAKKIAVMNMLRAETGLPPYQGSGL